MKEKDWNDRRKKKKCMQGIYGERKEYKMSEFIRNDTYLIRLTGFCVISYVQLWRWLQWRSQGQKRVCVFGGGGGKMCE